MNWKNNNLHQLTYSMINGDTYTVKQKKFMRQFCAKQINSTCIYCGGTYRKITGCKIENEDDEINHTKKQMLRMLPVCQLCHIVTQFMPNYSKMLMICKSKMSQCDIIRATVNFISAKKSFPAVSDIDTSAVIVKLTPTQFFKTCVNTDDLKGHKIFYTKNIDMTNIILGVIDMSIDFSNYVTEDSYIEQNTESQRKLETVQRLIKWYTKISELDQSVSKIEQLQTEIMLGQ